MPLAAYTAPSYASRERTAPRPQTRTETRPPEPEQVTQTTENVRHAHSRLQQFGALAITAAAVVALAIVAHHEYNKRKATGQAEPVVQDAPRPDPTRDWSRAVQPIQRHVPVEPIRLATPLHADTSTRFVRPAIPLQTEIATRPVPRVHTERSEAPKRTVRLQARSRIRRALSLSSLLTTASLVAQLLTSSQEPLDTRMTTDPIPPTPVTITGPRPTELAPVFNAPPVPSRAAETPVTGQSQGDVVVTPVTAEAPLSMTPPPLPVETQPEPPVASAPAEATIPAEATTPVEAPPAPVPLPAATEKPVSSNASPTPTETLVAPTLRPLIDEAAAQFGIPAGLMHAILYTESRGGLLDASIAGHTGDLAQMLPETFTDSVLGTHERVQQFAKQFGLDTTLDDETLRQQLLALYEGKLSIPDNPSTQLQVQMWAMAAYLGDRVGAYPVNPQNPESFLLAGLAYNAPGTAATTLKTLQRTLTAIDPSFASKSYAQQVEESNRLLAEILRAYYGIPLQNPTMPITVTATTSSETSEQEDNMKYTQLNLAVSIGDGASPTAQSFTLPNVQYLVQPKKGDLPTDVTNANVGLGNNLLQNMVVPVS